MRHIVVPCFVTLVLLTRAVGAEPSAFDAALAESQSNAARPGGEAFEEAVGKEFGVTHGPKVSVCAKQVKKPDLSDFDLLVKLSLEGRVEAALVRPETNLAVCLRDQMKGASLPAPVSAGYWVHIGLDLQR